MMVSITHNESLTVVALVLPLTLGCLGKEFSNTSTDLLKRTSRIVGNYDLGLS